MDPTPDSSIELSARTFKYWIIDRPRRRRGVVLQTGEERWEAIPEDVKKKSEIEPARQLIRLARDAGVAIPLSAANIRETGALFGDKRYELGFAMGSLAGGWMMRHPISVRRFELAQCLAQELGIKVPRSAQRRVFTLEPYAIYDNEPDAGLLSATDLKLFELAQISPSVILDVLLDPEKLPSAAPAKWVAVNQQITDMLRDSTLPKKQKEDYAYAYSWLDYSGSVLEAITLLGLDRTDIGQLTITDISRLLKSMKMTGIYTLIAMRRHTNKKTQWSSNDLTDMIFLSCAAAYADFVAAEKRTAEDLRQAHQTRGTRNNVFPTIESLVKALEEAGVQTETDRLGLPRSQ